MDQNGDIAQVADYYPFGMRHEPFAIEQAGQKHLYNGKELQDETGWYDYGWRQYDPQIGRWHVPDPLAEYHYYMNPYHYALNNPVRFIDPFGLDTIDPNIYEIPAVEITAEKTSWLGRVFKKIGSALRATGESIQGEGEETSSTDSFTTGGNAIDPTRNTSKHPDEVQSTNIDDFMAAQRGITKNLRYSPPTSNIQKFDNVVKGVDRTIKIVKTTDKAIKKNHTGNGEETDGSGRSMKNSPYNTTYTGSEADSVIEQYGIVFYDDSTVVRDKKEHKHTHMGRWVSDEYVIEK